MMVMTKSKMANRYSPEVRARAVRMLFEHQGSYETQAGAIAAIAPKIGCIPQTLSGWVKQAEKDSGMRDGVTTEERDRIKTLERENRELRQANEILRKGEAFVRHWSEDNGRALILRPLSSKLRFDCRAAGRNSTAH
jgi:transposase